MRIGIQSSEPKRGLRPLDYSETTGHIRLVPKPNHHEAILNAGLSVFHAHGFHASGVLDVVSQAGVPKGSFYNHFESKDALGVAVLERYWELSAEARAILQDEKIAPLKRLDRHLAALGCPPEGCLLGNFTAELAQSEAFRQPLSWAWTAWSTALAACLEDGRRDGSIRADLSAAELARTILALWEGAVLMSRVERSPKPLHDTRRNIGRLIAS